MINVKYKYIIIYLDKQIFCLIFPDFIQVQSLNNMKVHCGSFCNKNQWYQMNTYYAYTVRRKQLFDR